MFAWIDYWLNRITMYRLVLSVLVGLWAVAVVLSLLGVLRISTIGLVASAAIFVIFSWITNAACARILRVPTNVESFWITAFILVLIITPPRVMSDVQSFLVFAIVASMFAMVSKYVVTIRKKHLFNPAAFAVALTALVIHQSASWWIGTAALAPFVLIGGLLVVRKVQRFDAVLIFLGAALAMMLGSLLFHGVGVLTALRESVLETPILFFASIMLTEPLTMPPSRAWRMIYGALVGFLFAPAVHIGSIYGTPELALLVGNIFSYMVSPKEKLLLTLREKQRAAADVYDFVFDADRLFRFRAGEYLEWTLAHAHPDARGNRRYFTIASSPTEKTIRIGVKFYPRPSSFKQKLFVLRLGDTVTAGARAGDFVLPRDSSKKLLFIAGGIGITPFRSMLKFLIDQNERRDIAVLYANRRADSISYQNILREAAERLGVRVIYTLTDADSAPADWQGCRGPIDAAMIAREAPDYRERLCFISGSRAMVNSFQEVLGSMGVPRRHIKTDFFPGLA